MIYNLYQLINSAVSNNAWCSKAYLHETFKQWFNINDETSTHSSHLFFRDVE